MRPKSCTLALAALLSLALCVAAARADEPEPEPAPPRVLFSGFGTLGVVHSSQDKADYTSTIFQPQGAGHSHAWSPEVDSLIAGQVTARLTSKLRAVVQVISEQKHDGTYWPHLEWANVQYQFTPDFSLRVGRTVLPIFIVADSRKIAYANPWVRPPLEVYSLAPITSNDGVDALYRLRVRGTTSTLQVAAGRSDSRFPGAGSFGAGTLKARGLVTVVGTLEKGFATVRLNFGRTRLTIPEFGPLFDAFRQFGPEGIAIADKYDARKSLVTFLGMGMTYDPGKWFATGEWGRVNTRSAIGTRAGWYASGGYRFWKSVTTHVTYAQMRADRNTSDPGLTVAGLPPPQASLATGLNAALNVLLDTKVVQSTTSVGGRWDFATNAAFKLQLARSRHGAGSAGVLINLQPGFQRGGSVYVFTATVDFVF